MGTFHPRKTREQTHFVKQRVRRAQLLLLLRGVPQVVPTMGRGVNEQTPKSEQTNPFQPVGWDDPDPTLVPIREYIRRKREGC